MRPSLGKADSARPKSKNDKKLGKGSKSPGSKKSKVPKDMSFKEIGNENEDSQPV